MGEHLHGPGRLSRESKRHAVLRDQPGRVLWVLDAQDWQTMLDNDTSLVCPEPGCAVRLFPRPRSPHAKMARHLWLGTKHGGGCEHWIGGTDGAPMTPRHLWVQTRILRICRDLGYTAVPEDQHTRADVFVTDPATALEVQLRGTKFQERTATRREKGADTIWFLGHDVSWRTKSVKDTLATLKTVRFKVIDTSARNWKASEFEPWADPDQLDDRAEIQVYGTVFTLNPTADPSRLEHTYLPIRQFLDEVLSGQRRWIPRGQPGMPVNQSGYPRPGWVRPAELATVREVQRPQRSEPPAPPATPAPAIPKPEAPPRTPVPPVRPAAPPPPEPDVFDVIGGLLVLLLVIAAIVGLLIVLT